METIANLQEEAVAGPHDAEKVRILILEDEKQIQEILARILAKGGYESIAASSAAEARKIIQQESFALVLSDINLPGESGLSFARWVHHTYPETPIDSLTDKILTKNKLLDQVHAAIRTRHYSRRTERAYIHWIRQYILFIIKSTLKMSEQEIKQYWR